MTTPFERTLIAILRRKRPGYRWTPDDRKQQQPSKAKTA